MKRTTTYLFFALLIFACGNIKEKDNYIKDSTISSFNGIPKDSLTFYYPVFLKRDSQLIKSEIDTFELTWYSCALFAAREPILFNYYQGHDMYRFLWLRSFHRPIILTLHKKSHKVWLHIKVLDKQPSFNDITYVKFKSENSETEGIEVDSTVKADRKANIVINESKKLTRKNWKEFEELLNKCSFWTTKPCTQSRGFDGSEWIIEGHLKNKYWYVQKWSPRDEFRKAGEYLIKQSGLDERIY